MDLIRVVFAPCLFKEAEPSIGAFCAPLFPKDKGAVGHPVASRGGEVAREVPVSLVVGDGGVKAVNTLEDDADFCAHVGRGQQFGNLGGCFLFG